MRELDIEGIEMNKFLDDPRFGGIEPFAKKVW
jgi:hypothetical protein